MKDRLLIFLCILSGLFFCSCQGSQEINGRAYYVSSEGMDSNTGLSEDQAWRSLNKVNEHSFSPGDTLYFRAGDEFTGTLRLSYDDAGSSEHRLHISSFGTGKARIDGLEGRAVYADSCSFFTLENLELYGLGRKSGSGSDGLLLMNSHDVDIHKLDIHGFQHSGIHVYKCQDISISHVHAHDNGFAGIHVSGSSIWETDTYDNTNIHIAHCIAENNPGDPTVLDNHSGNGILASSVRKGCIEYCEAFNNGWDMPWTGNGPVGIWIWDCTDFTIQHCVSHHNRTNPQAKDGGGFDLDGGVSNSVIQYCISHNNEGIGYGLFEFGAAKAWKNNTIRYCISHNDGSLNQGSLGIWKSDGEGSLSSCQIYNNTFYNSMPGSGNLWIYDNYPDIQFRNNVFVYTGNFLVEGSEIKDELFEGNLYWNLNGKSSFLTFESLEQWAEQSGKEMMQGHLSGFYADPKLSEFNTSDPIDPGGLGPESFRGLVPESGSPLIDQGLNLKELIGLDQGSKDLRGTQLPQGKQYDIGAIEYR